MAEGARARCSPEARDSLCSHECWVRVPDSRQRLGIATTHKPSSSSSCAVLATVGSATTFVVPLASLPAQLRRLSTLRPYKMSRPQTIRQLICLAAIFLVAICCAPAVEAAKKRPRSTSGGSASANARSSSSSGSGIPPSFMKEAASSPHGIVELPNPQSFVQLTSGPRNYSSVVLLTAVKSGVSCQPCNTFAPVYENIAGSWKRKSKNNHKADVIFSLLEFKDGQDVFRQVSASEISLVLLGPS